MKDIYVASLNFWSSIKNILLQSYLVRFWSQYVTNFVTFEDSPYVWGYYVYFSLIILIYLLNQFIALTLQRLSAKLSTSMIAQEVMPECSLKCKMVF